MVMGNGYVEDISNLSVDDVVYYNPSISLLGSNPCFRNQSSRIRFFNNNNNNNNHDTFAFPASAQIYDEPTSSNYDLSAIPGEIVYGERTKNKKTKYELNHHHQQQQQQQLVVPDSCSSSSTSAGVSQSGSLVVVVVDSQETGGPTGSHADGCARGVQRKQPRRRGGSGESNWASRGVAIRRDEEALTLASPLASVNAAVLADAGALASAISPSLMLRDLLQVTRLLDQRYWYKSACSLPNEVAGSYGLPPTPARRALFILYQTAVPYLAERIRNGSNSVSDSSLISNGSETEIIRNGIYSVSDPSLNQKRNRIPFLIELATTFLETELIPSLFRF
ncbi:hypothetical protein Syun_020951 [Stephania yunnanensis]|uniref:Uncharacterized protein n=1 Tax=Stephania yunnanensis TaxID=152371 RepID=A0AAP0IET3_9MAGN